MIAGLLTIVVSLLSAGTIALQQPETMRPPTGTAIISGVVVSASTPATPVRHAIVQLSGGRAISLSAVTNDEGLFTIGFVPAGTYSLLVSKPAYLTTAYGSKSIGGPGTELVIHDSQQITDLRIPLIKGAAISGTIRDYSGDPAEGVRLSVARAELRRSIQDTALSLLAVGSVTIDTVITDDLGRYRVFGLPPGSYLVAALPAVTGTSGIDLPSSNQVDAELRLLQQPRGTALPAGAGPTLRSAGSHGYAPTYYPSTAIAARAETVTVAAGEDRSGVDILLNLVSIGTVDVTVIGVDGRPTSAVSVVGSTQGPPLPLSFGLTPFARPTQDNVFHYTNVPAGQWTFTARPTARVTRFNPDGSLSSISGDANELPPGPFLWAAATVEVSGGATAVTLRLRPGVTMTGRVVFDTAAGSSSPVPAQVRLSMQPNTDPDLASTAAFPGAPVTSATPSADGSFQVRALTPGPWILNALVPGRSGPNGWWMRAAMQNGRDLLDESIEIAETDLTDVVITMSNKHTELSGSLLNADGRPMADLTVLIIPEDRAAWKSTRRVQQMRPASSGRFAFADLPPGDYLLAAVTDVPGEKWRTEEFLGTIVSAAVKVRIAEGEKKVQDLRVK
jgi:uncharacterized protein (DUF2141 family)